MRGLLIIHGDVADKAQLFVVILFKRLPSNIEYEIKCIFIKER